MDSFRGLMNKIAIIGSSIVISMFVTGITLYSVTKYISEQDRLYTSINDPTVRHDHLNNEPVTHPTLQDSIVYNLKPIVQNIVYGILVLTAYPILYSSRFLRMLRTLRLDIIHRNIYLVVKCILIQLILYNWNDVPGLTLWRLNTYDDNSAARWTFYAVHILCWTVYYAQFLMYDDIVAYFGFTQVITSILPIPLPTNKKRHSPGRLTLVALLLLAFCHPVMNAGRLIAAVFLLVVFGASTNPPPPPQPPAQLFDPSDSITDGAGAPTAATTTGPGAMMGGLGAALFDSGDMLMTRRPAFRPSIDYKSLYSDVKLD